MKVARWLVATCTGMASSLALSAEPGINLDLRYRLEAVDDAAFAEEALASTLRTRLGYLTPEREGLKGFIEFEDVRVVGPDDYNSTANGKLAYPVVADPADTELNQAWLEYGLTDGFVRGGRQRINLVNQRFFGAVGFRQNEQTFDALVLDHGLGGGRFQFAYIDQVNRVFGQHHPNPALAETDSRTVIADYERKLGIVTTGIYAHAIELPDSPLSSHRNVGLRAQATHGAFDWRVELAQQDAYRDGAPAIDAGYLRADLGWQFEGIRLALLHEVLGGDGVYAFQTPFATLHAFNGVVDKFLVTPVNGLVDNAVTLTGNVADWKYGAQYHRFTSDAGTLDYGDEISAFVARPFNESINWRFEVADYQADEFSSDTRKFWFTVNASF